MLNPHLLPKIRSEAIMQAMQRYPCALRVASFFPGHTCAPQATVVGCHVGNIGKGMATKTTDLAVAAGCLHCHDIVDGRDIARRNWIEDRYPAAYAHRLLVGLIETHARLAADGIIMVEGAE